MASVPRTLADLSHDELGVIFDGLVDPLCASPCVTLASICRWCRQGLHPNCEHLKKQTAAIKAMAAKLYVHGRVGAEQNPYWRSRVGHNSGAPHGTLQLLQDATRLSTSGRKMVSVIDMQSLVFLAVTNGMHALSHLYVNLEYESDTESDDESHDESDEGTIFYGDYNARAHGLLDGLKRGTLPSLLRLDLSDSGFGLGGAEAVASALHRGAMPKLNTLQLSNNHFGDDGVRVLNGPLRARNEMISICMPLCEIGDDGVHALIDNLGPDDFQQVARLEIFRNSGITDASRREFMATMKAGHWPRLWAAPYLHLPGTALSPIWQELQKERAAKARARFGDNWQEQLIEPLRQR